MTNTLTKLPYALIKENGQTYVSLRSVHQYLDVDQDFVAWCKSAFRFWSPDKIDYKTVRVGTGRAHNKVDYLMDHESFQLFAEIQTVLYKKRAHAIKRKIENTVNEGCKIVRLKPRPRDIETRPAGHECIVVPMYPYHEAGY